MQYFSLIFLFTLVNLSRQEVKLYNVRQLTSTGQHSHPKFSADNRYIYFSASGGDYGKECEEIYRLDLKYLDKPSEPNRISKVSPGLGQSTSVGTSNLNDDVYYESTFEKAIESQNSYFNSSNHLCPISKCSSSNPPAACSQKIYTEHFFDTYIYSTSSTTKPLQRQQDKLSSKSYAFSPAQAESFTAYTKDCLVKIVPFDGSAPYTASSTCLYINDKQPFNEDQGLAMYYDFFSMGKETETGRVRFAYQKSRYPTQNLPDLNVFPQNFVDLYDGVLEKDGTITTEFSNRFCEQSYSTMMLFPNTFQDGKKPGILYTAVDASGNRSVKACFGGFESQQITALDKNSMQASARNDYKQIVYLQQDNTTKEYQIFLADLVNNLKTSFSSKSLTSANRKINDNLELSSYIELKSQLGRVKLTKQASHVYFEQNTKDGINCKQVTYHKHFTTSINVFH